MRKTSHPASRAVVVCGVAGSGKSTIAALLAAELRWTYVDADSLHSPINVEQMRQGIGLADVQREPWLRAVRDRIILGASSGPQVIACSALKRTHRDVLRGGKLELFFVQLVLSPAQVLDRLVSRPSHFAGPTLIESQLADFEPLHESELGIQVDASQTQAAIVATLRTQVKKFMSSTSPREGKFHS